MYYSSKKKRLNPNWQLRLLVGQTSTVFISVCLSFFVLFISMLLDNPGPRILFSISIILSSFCIQYIRYFLPSTSLCFHSLIIPLVTFVLLFFLASFLTNPFSALTLSVLLFFSPSTLSSFPLFSLLPFHPLSPPSHPSLAERLRQGR